jgi:hypothetical protein
MNRPTDKQIDGREGRDAKSYYSVPSLVALRRSEGRNSKIWPAFILVVSSLVLALPLLLYGPLRNGHDTYEHLNYTKHFVAQFWSGDLYPRWLIDMNKGLGSPSYFLYPPLPAYVVALLDPIATALRLNAFNVAAWLPLVGSGFAAFVWLRASFGERIATVCAVVYMAMPYHLGIDFYRRCAISENWAFVWMPLLLYFTAGVALGKVRAIVGWAITLALFICSHPNSALIFCWIPLCLAMLNPGSSPRIIMAIRLGVAGVLSLFLSSVYLLPAVANAKYMPVSRLMSGNPGYLLSNQLIFAGRRLIIHPGREMFIQWISWAVICLAFVVVFCGIVALKWHARVARGNPIFWIAVCGVLVFMMSNFSTPVWQNLPQLHQTIQYPWRLTGPLCVGVTAILGSFLSCMNRRSWAHRAVFGVVATLLVGPSLFAYGNAWWHYKKDATPFPNDGVQLVNEHDGWFHTWIVPGTSQRASLLASLGPRVRFQDVDGTVAGSLWEPRRIEFETNSAVGGWVMINQFYYPTWQAESINDHRPLLVRPAMPEGLLEVQVQPGTEKVQVDLPASSSERLGRWLSLIGLLICLLGVFGEKPGKRWWARWDPRKPHAAVLTQI